MASEAEVPVKISVAAPAYNEEALIEATVRGWKACADRSGIPMEFVVCDDGSTDGTRVVLEGLRKDIPELRVVVLPRNRGYGAAMSAAIAACRGEYVATIDSDGQFDLHDIVPMLALCEDKGFDAVTGYRCAKADRWTRVAGDRGFRFLIRILFHVRLRDTNCALKLVRREWLQRTSVKASGYPFPTEVCLRLLGAGARVAELPVSHRERDRGASKLNVLRTAWRMFSFAVCFRFQDGFQGPRV